MLDWRRHPPAGFPDEKATATVPVAATERLSRSDTEAGREPADSFGHRHGRAGFDSA